MGAAKRSHDARDAQIGDDMPMRKRAQQHNAIAERSGAGEVDEGCASDRCRNSVEAEADT